MTILLVLAILELIGFALIRSHPEVRAIFKSGTWADRWRGNLALLGLWPLMAIALCFEDGASDGSGGA